MLPAQNLINVCWDQDIVRTKIPYILIFKKLFKLGGLLFSLSSSTGSINEGRGYIRCYIDFHDSLPKWFDCMLDSPDSSDHSLTLSTPINVVATSFKIINWKQNFHILFPWPPSRQNIYKYSQYVCLPSKYLIEHVGSLAQLREHFIFSSGGFHCWAISDNMVHLF